MFCNNCGKQLPDNTKFCPGCGTKVSGEQVQQPIEPQAQFAQPVQPVQPVQPIQPVQPVQPVQPIPPVQPIQPVQPVQPIQQPYERPVYTQPQAQQPFPPGQYQQPQPYGYAQQGYVAPQYGAVQPKKKNKTLLFVLLALVLVAAIAVACIFIFGGGGGDKLTGQEISGTWTGTVEYTNVGGLLKDLYSEYMDTMGTEQTQFVFTMGADGKTGTVEWYLAGVSQGTFNVKLSGSKVIVEGTYNAMDLSLTLKPKKAGTNYTMEGTGSFGDPSIVSVDFKVSLSKTGGGGAITDPTASPTTSVPVSGDLASVILGEWTTEPDYDNGSYLFALRENGAFGYGYAYPEEGQQISDYDEWYVSYWDWNDYVLQGNSITTTDRYGDAYTYTVEMVGTNELHLSQEGDTLVFFRVKSYAEMSLESYLAGEWASVNAVYDDGSYSYLMLGEALVSVGSVEAYNGAPDYGDWYGDDWGYANVYDSGTYILSGSTLTMSLSDGSTHVFTVQILDAYNVRLTNTSTNTYTDYCKLT